MPMIRVNDSAGGRYTKTVFDHIQTNRSAGQFTYRDLPEVAPDFLAFIEGAMRQSNTVYLGSSREMAKSTVLKELQKLGLIETVALKTFALTESGKSSSVVIG